MKLRTMFSPSSRFNLPLPRPALWMPSILIAFSLGFGPQAAMAENAAVAVPAEKPAAPPPGALDPKVRGILKGAVDFYAGVQSFEVDIDSVTHLGSAQINRDMPASFHLALQRPGSFACVMKSGMMGGAAILSNGKTSVTYIPVLKKYTSSEAPAALADVFSPMNMAIISGGLPIGFEAFLQNDALEGFEHGLQQSEYVGAETISDRPAHHVRLTASPYVVDYWIASGGRPLLLQVQVAPDMSAMMKAIPEEQKKKLPAGMDSMKMSRTSVYAKWQVNQPVAASAFRFEPPSGASLVEAFFTPPPHPLVGKMAPEFQLNDLEGKPVKLSGLLGKVVVLDFWATWCAPCVASLPMVNAATSERKAQGVIFFAVNQKESAETIRGFQKKKNLDFPALLDPEGSVGKLYQANSIPESVLIGKDGRIEAIHVGYNASLKTQLGKQLDDLLAGKPLLDANAPSPVK